MDVSMGFLLIGGVIFLVIVIGAIVLIGLLASGTHSSSPVAAPGAGETPLQILDRRFASGGINAEEYKRARDLLTGGGPKT